jgi:FtsP/CotA-like multicopper oxidase with cupredoxin domain
MLQPIYRTDSRRSAPARRRDVFWRGWPEQWFTSNGLKGKDFFSYGHPGPGEAIYVYENLQEPGTLWFHDHALGATRTNVYSGMAAFYFLRGPLTEPWNLPSGAYEIEMAIQDRQFDTNGQLFFPDGSPNGNPNSPLAVCGDGTPNDPCLNGGPPNPNIHAFWIPEFFGDVAIVNGAPWPVLQVEPRRYLFRLLDGSNARMYSLTFGAPGEPSPPVYVIGMDDNYLDAPVKVNGRTISFVDGNGIPQNLPAQIFVAPGERNYVIVDFSKLAGKTITLTNNAPAPFPSGGLLPGTSGQVGMAQIMQFQVTVPLKGKKDTSCNPAMGGCERPISMVRLADGNGNVEHGVKVDKVRQLVLKEHEGQGGDRRTG